MALKHQYQRSIAVIAAWQTSAERKAKGKAQLASGGAEKPRRESGCGGQRGVKKGYGGVVA